MPGVRRSVYPHDSTEYSPCAGEVQGERVVLTGLMGPWVLCSNGDGDEVKNLVMNWFDSTYACRCLAFLVGIGRIFASFIIFFLSNITL